MSGSPKEKQALGKLWTTAQKGSLSRGRYIAVIFTSPDRLTPDPTEAGNASIGTIAGSWLDAYPDLDPANP